MKRLLLLFIIPCVAKAQNVDSVFIKKISDEILVNGKAYDNLRVLTKKIGHRLSGSQAYNKAVYWGDTTMKAQGADNVFLQECMVPHWVRGSKDVATASYKSNGKTATIPLTILALGNSNGTGDKGISSNIILVKSFDDLDEKKDQIKGKIVVYDIPFENEFINTFRAYGKNARYRVVGASRAAKYGAVAVVVRSMTHTPGDIPHTGSMIYNDSFPKIPAVAIGLESLDKLKQLYVADPSLSIKLTTHGKMLPDTIAHNVIGELKGAEFPNEYITIGGHLDSWDVGEGANDDGAGVVQTMEVLRALKVLGYQPKRNIRFVLYANEENGTRGGKKYAEVAKLKNEQHIFALESDEGGFTPRGFGFSLEGERLQKIQPWLELLRPYGIDFLTSGGGGADIGFLQASGTVVSNLEPDTQRYFDIHHTATDVFENVSRRELLLGAVNMTALIYLIDKYGL